MNLITLSQILSLVGPLDDTPGENSARERFRIFLKENITDVGQIRDYIEECLRTPGPQYARALQDLINHLGTFLGFEITFGRYQGTQGKIGFDGLWRSANDFYIVIEVKTTEVYAIKTATLLNYINELTSEKTIRPEDECIGLYVVGRPDPEVRQLQNAIIAEKKTDRLRIVSAESLLSLADLMNEFDMAHSDVLALIRPSVPSLDPIVELMARLVAQRPALQDRTVEIGEAPRPVPTPPVEAGSDAPVYWLTPVKTFPEETAEECIAKLVGKERIYAFGENTPGRKRIKPGDWICFYSNGKGVVAHAKVASYPENRPHRAVRQSERYPWVFRVSDTVLYVDDPVVIDSALRGRLQAFKGRDLSKSWAWFVQGTGTIDEPDFRLLTRTIGRSKAARAK